MNSFQVIHKEPTYVCLNSQDYKFVWYTNIKNSKNYPIQASEIEIGDSLILSNGFFYLQPQVINPLSSFSNFLSTSCNKQFISNYYKDIRIFPPGPDNFFLCFAYKIVEFSYIWKNPKILKKLSQSVLSYSKSLIDYFLNDMNSRSFSSAFESISNSIPGLKYLGKDILQIYNNNYTICLEDLEISLKTVNYPDMSQVYVTNSGVNEFVFLNHNQNYSILYTDDEVSLLKSEGELKVLQQFYSAQHNMPQMVVARQETWKSSIKENEEIIKLIVEQVKSCIESLRIDDSVNRVISYLKSKAVNVYALEEAIRSKKCFFCSHTNKQCFMLNCKHYLCGQCLYKIVKDDTDGKFVLNDEEKKKHPPSKCRINGCTGTITEDILSKVLENYNSLKKAADSRICYNCLTCKSQLEINHFILSCRHNCNNCAFNKMRENCFFCDACGDYFPQEDLIKLVSLKKTCEGCHQQVNQYKGFSLKICEHELCLVCIEAAVNKGMCPINKNPIGKDINLSNIITKPCGQCKQSYKVVDSYDNYKLCHCAICEECLISKNELKSCLSCQYPFFQECLNYLVDHYKQCNICYFLKFKDEFKTLDPCSHYFCTGCLKSSSKAHLISKNIDSIIKCPECSVNISPKQYDDLFPKEVVEQIVAFNLEVKNDFLNCYKCKNHFICIEKLRKQRCNQCEAMTCLNCQEMYHEEDFDCKEKFIQERIKEVIGLADENGVTQCPGCRTPYIKNHECDHVNCINRKCGMVFCFKCSCVRGPVIAHGNHYHRPECPYYSKSDEKDKYKGDCLKCVKLGKLCGPPKKLRVPRRVDKDEAEEII